MSWNAVEEIGRSGTHETEPVCTWVVRGVSRQIFTGHPIRNELEGICGGTQ